MLCCLISEFHVAFQGFYKDAACGVKASTSRNVGSGGIKLENVFSCRSPQYGLYKAGDPVLLLTAVTLRCSNTEDFIPELSFALTSVEYCKTTSKVKLASWSVSADGSPESTWESDGHDLIIFHWGNDTPSLCPPSSSPSYQEPATNSSAGLEDVDSNNKRQRKRSRT